MGFKEKRKACGLTQCDVAKLLGVTHSAVAMWETGRVLPRAALLKKIAELYQCTVDELLK